MTEKASPILVTTEHVPHLEIVKVLGIVMGVTVRTRNLGAQMAAGLRTIIGGEMTAVVESLTASRELAMDRLAANACLLGADAVIGVRLVTSELGDIWTEFCAYGTAVQVRKTLP
ncbi:MULTISPECIES: YbjQ family protein [Microtetraspora]|uniref:UPF0145 protein AB0I59_38905 n=1 Tax=Microtetraspora glauca TaxID=1996 RepID=A0ABV3GT52_MICGL|nr:YbjQ family protein [Microtetraspora sp. AC03309]